MASIKDVAKLANVAISTVSLVANNKGYVSDATKAKVQKAMKELNYTPSDMGRNLSLRRTNLVGIIVPSVSHPFFGSLVQDCENILYQHGYKTMVCSTNTKNNAEQAFVDMLKRHAMDGIIMGAHSKNLDIYKNLDRPVVAFDRYISDDIPVVHCNHVKGGQLAAMTFLKHNCKHIIHITGSKRHSSPASSYHEVFEQTMTEAGVFTEALPMPWNAFTPLDFDKIAQVLFHQFPDVDGILGADMAISSCLRFAHRRGIIVPEQLKLLAYDGTYVTHLGSQTITAVTQPLTELAYQAVEAILALIQHQPLPPLPELEPYLQHGTTC